MRVLEKIGSTTLFAGLLFGVFVVIVAPFEIVAKLRAESWPSRRGVITTSSVTRRTGVRAPYYVAEIGGTYRDSGERFWIRRVRYGGFRWGAGKALAEAVVARYPVGREIDVYYSPTNPRETALEPRSPWTEMIVLVGLGLGFLLVPVVLWMLRPRDETAPEPAPHRAT